jgi:hypothetical protein
VGKLGVCTWLLGRAEGDQRTAARDGVCEKVDQPLFDIGRARHGNAFHCDAQDDRRSLFAEGPRRYR